jgi:hypothetical protein
MIAEKYKNQINIQTLIWSIRKDKKRRKNDLDIRNFDVTILFCQGIK